MDLRISSATSPLAGAGLARRAAAPQLETKEAGFPGALKGALQSVSANQKAQIGFQATLHVRNRMVQAYTDIMNMQV